MISIHMLVISVVERCFRLGLNYLNPLKKKLIYINYCAKYIRRPLQYLHAYVHSEYIYK